MPQANTHMSHRPTYVDYSSPDSEHSEYFDAPMMRFFSQSTSKTSTPDLAAAAAEEERAPSRAGSTLPIQADDPSAALASLSITADDYRPVNTDSEEESPRGVQLQDPPVDSANRKNRQSDDSGYGSTHRAKNMTVVEAIRSGDEPDEEDGIKPIPVVWSDTAVARRVAGDSPAKRTSSLRSFRSQPNGEGRRASGNHHRSASLSGGSFLNGPGTVGPNSELPIDESLRQRRVAADALLTKKQKLKIGKAECMSYLNYTVFVLSCLCAVKEGKRLGKIIKQEAKAEKKALNISMRELSEIQKTQKVAIKVRYLYVSILYAVSDVKP